MCIRDRPTPLIGGLSIHASMLLSTLFMLFLVDYKYDLQFDPLSLNDSTKLETPSQVGYSKRLTIKKENTNGSEDFRVTVPVDFGLNKHEWHPRP